MASAYLHVVPSQLRLLRTRQTWWGQAMRATPRQLEAGSAGPVVKVSITYLWPRRDDAGFSAVSYLTSGAPSVQTPGACHGQHEHDPGMRIVQPAQHTLGGGRQSVQVESVWHHCQKRSVWFLTTFH